MAVNVIQMVTCGGVGGETIPVEVKGPITAQSLTAAAAKKFKSVTKQSRVYHGVTGEELTGEVLVESLRGAFVVFSAKSGWKGAARLAALHNAGTDPEQPAADASAAVHPVVEDSSSSGADMSEALVYAAKSERAKGVVLCWKETQDNGYLSNWASSPITIDDVHYTCVEQWIMASKARACGDSAVLQQILSSRSPRKMKGLGRSLNSKMVNRFWTQQAKWITQLQGARAKFQQNKALAVKLLGTGRKQIAEASPADRIFGIGLAPSDPLAQNPENWRGTNILGKALMQVREEIRMQVLSQHTGLGGDAVAAAEAMPELESDCPAGLEETSEAETESSSELELEVRQRDNFRATGEATDLVQPQPSSFR
mmetsp:Transcript_120429/g.239678  ORF Transcript_120429/g.239678 Transcript_120429/m.239678 type:complete len:369 (-) Transcript_120429:486-1592(-)|eukprot:CAMPEP_0172687408 /NCGR_PEP_ID=MMETSP1074-20121228/21659_1 /TAXON_ID=2916 /ORGANISM="Ceratium fusus, Strain PA161109" /LENGTH=368 /DNA_ID=CAMNT_0013506859 /DNA_START=83 /DNA_END=1189 /DNA_ORIENTATION=-